MKVIVLLVWLSMHRRRQSIKENVNQKRVEARTEEIKIQKKRPNHFVAIRVSDPAIHLAIKGFQDAVLKENEKLKPALIPLLSLHITMAVMHLDETTIKIAQDALEKCKDEISRALQAVDHKLIFSGVGNFNNQIVFAKLLEKQQIDCLKNINSVIKKAFEEDEICLTDKKEYNPHLTLIKKRSFRKDEIKKIYESYLDKCFGEESVKKVHLYRMGPKEDGSYECVSTITCCNDSDMGETKAAK
jgi:A-kinase anchor protein 7